MHTSKGWIRALIVLSSAIVVALAVGAVATSAAAETTVKPYVKPVGGEYEITPLFSADDKVRLIGGVSGQQYRMVGIPDGLGAHRSRGGRTTLFMNHELPARALSEPVVDGPKNRGAIISKFILDREGNPVAGRRAYDWIFEENAFVGPAPTTENATRAFARFCSGFLAGRAHGFDRWIYLTNEEEGTAAESFDGKGGVSVAIFGRRLHTLPALGHFSKENTVVQRGRGRRTVIFSFEDGPGLLENQLYMYVGKKKRESHSALARNGLKKGKLYVFRSLDLTRNSERTFVSGSVSGEWVEIPDAENLTDVELEAASDAVNAMTFVRPEDGAFNRRSPNELFWVTTGSSRNVDDGVNELGRLYSLQLHRGNPLKPATLTVVYNADVVVAAGGDIAISPDNIDTSRRYLMINEGGTREARPVLVTKARDLSVWRFDLTRGRANAVGVDVSTATRVAELNPPGRDGVPVGPGVWETSGIIDTASLFGADTWLSNVQAHQPTGPPPDAATGPTVTFQDGQLFLMRPTDEEP